MIVYSQDHLIPTDVNVMTLQDSAGGYFYIHRSLYDQAVILDYLYPNYNDLAQITGEGHQQADRPDVGFFHEHAPHPIRIFAPFLLLCPEEFTTIEDMTGALSVMANVISFKYYPKVPLEIRNNTMLFSMSIREEYSLSWHAFFQKTIPYDESIYFQQGSAPVQYVQAPAPMAEVEEEAEEETTEDDGVDISLPAFDFISTEPEEGEQDGKDNNEEAQAEPPANEQPSGLDYLKSLL